MGLSWNTVKYSPLLLSALSSKACIVDVIEPEEQAAWIIQIRAGYDQSRQYFTNRKYSVQPKSKIFKEESGPFGSQAR